MFGKRSLCSLCRHKNVEAINADIRADVPSREIAERYDVSKSAAARHAMHLLVVDPDDSDDGLKSMLDSAQRALRRAEAKGDHKGVLESLRFLGELRKRGRIHRAVSTEQPQERKNPQDLVAQLKQIYGLKGQGSDRAIGKRTRTVPSDAELVEILRERVLRDGTRPEIAAVATRLASLLLKVPLDAATERDVRQFEGGEYELGGMVETTDKLGADAGESADERDESRDGDDERHIDSPDVDDHG
jgi:hypothetical protein